MDEIYVANCENLEWVPAKFPRAQMKVLMMDSRAGGQILLLKLEPMCVMPAHSHISAEASYVLEGDLVEGEGGNEGKTYHEGWFAYFPAGVNHGPYHTENGCVILNIFYGPVS